MDKDVVRALLAADDNSLRIAHIERTLKSTGAILLSGTQSFGTVEADKSAVIVRFDGGAVSLMFGGTAVASGASPLLAVISGKGELALSEARTGAAALVIGKARVEK